MKKTLSPFAQTILATVVSIAIIEVLSFGVFVFPSARNIIFVLIAAFAILLSLFAPRLLVYILWAELLIGSKGYLFSTIINGQSISLRLVLFGLMMALFLVDILRYKKTLHLPPKMFPLVCVFALILLLASVNGLRHGYALTDVFLDMNGYLYLGLLFPFLLYLHTPQHFRELLGVTIGAGIMVFLKSAFLLLVFSHKILPWMSYLYPWVRKTGVGEITLLPDISDSFYRIFFQSHFFIPAFLILLVSVVYFFLHSSTKPLGELLKRRQTWMVFLACVISVSLVLLSYSRSFWLALAFTLLCFAVTLFFLHRRLRPLALSLLTFIFASGLGLLLLVGIINVPLGGFTGAGIGGYALLEERTTKSDAASGSRFNLLPPLMDKVWEQPLIGSGFGTPVTYKTLDARALATNPDGNFTTYSFEWAYLDMITEMGLIGLSVILALFVIVLKTLWQRFRAVPEDRVFSRALLMGSFFSLLFLLATHATTPYISHPLGLGLFIVATLIAVNYDRSTAEAHD